MQQKIHAVTKLPADFKVVIVNKYLSDNVLCISVYVSALILHWATLHPQEPPSPADRGGAAEHHPGGGAGHQHHPGTGGIQRNVYFS